MVIDRMQLCNFIRQGKEALLDFKWLFHPEGILSYAFYALRSLSLIPKGNPE